MSLHGWAGPGKLRELSLDRAQSPTITEPTSPDADGFVHAEKLHVCNVHDCGKRFKLAAILARHFNSNHSDLREDKDTWRKYQGEVWE